MAATAWFRAANRADPPTGGRFRGKIEKSACQPGLGMLSERCDGGVAAHARVSCPQPSSVKWDIGLSSASELAPAARYDPNQSRPVAVPPIDNKLMRSSKSRSRNKSNRQRTLGNVVNRVFDSSGPEGKVRGTPQQIIEKYLTLARDAQLSNDRVAEQSFLQHAEHYTRMLGEAQREQAERQGHQNGQTRDEDRDDGHQGESGQSWSGQNGHRAERADDNRGDLSLIHI